MNAFEKTKKLSVEMGHLHSVGQLLSWDQETYMPKKGNGPRAAQSQLIAELHHKMHTGATFRKALAAAAKEKGLSREQKACVREWEEDLERARKLPTSFVSKFAHLTAEAVVAWRSAREAKSFRRFAPYLEKIIGMCQEKAELLGYNKHPYDALVDEYERGMTQGKVSKLFGSMKDPLISLRAEVLSRKQPKTDFLFGKVYGHKKQMEFAHTLIEATGFDPERSRLDLTAHPFCISLHPDDHRVTTRVDLRDPMSNFLAAMHEGGHMLYEQQLPSEHFGTPLCQAVSMALHESQSRWWETRIGQSNGFWKYYFPKMKKLFPHQLKGVSLSAFYKALNVVSETPIRVSSDEVSYPLHIILRFEMESDLIDGTITVRDVPEAWNSKMEKYLNITPKSDAEGCLQDIHWSFGGFGYFPTYSLGNLYAAQFFETFAKEHPNWESQIGKGKFVFIREWLQEHIHRHGRMYSGAQLAKRITGKALSTEPYLNYLNEKYRTLF